ncbi:LptF/LptG family permease [Parabacteroides pacaensis]|uniref:LptF/LptG family permease n=1 Tax=Parabacteroides pacaensis TaxID=2086575 RepID=UPI000D0FFB1D|nr:LptF/LptG family permease [Parabacteroides pacaensis]
MLQTFLPLFFMTFGICLFIVLMQFLWRYIDDMVGKGLDIPVLGEMLFYAALSLVPMALPLSILLASLMTFGNLGERLELLAMKSAGISLVHIMRPLIITLFFISIGAFFFQNNVTPISQVKLYTLLSSMRQKSPELDIPEGAFCNEIAGYNLYVKQKDKKTGLLRDIMIYDYSHGFEQATVIVADSGRLKTAANKLFLVLTLYNGESFQNLKEQKNSVNKKQEAVPYRRETFATREILIEFDANFTRLDDSYMQNQYVGKGLKELQSSIDSMTVRLDSIKNVNAQAVITSSYKKTLGIPSTPVTTTKQTSSGDKNSQDNISNLQEETEEKKPVIVMNYDSLYQAQTPATQSALLSRAITDVDGLKSNYFFNAAILGDDAYRMRRHFTEWHRKFTVPFACIVFFFIGAPLGAIIRKGGLGMPVVISVVLFIFYYIIDNIGFKMARDGIWDAWEGMWLSSAILTPLGIFLTYKAVNDSVILNGDTYINAIKNLFGKRSGRNIIRKEVIILTPDYKEITEKIDKLTALAQQFLQNNKRWRPYFSFWKQGNRDHTVSEISDLMEDIIEETSNSDQNLILNKLMDYPILKGYNIHSPLSGFWGILLGLILPIGIPFYLIAMYKRRFLIHDIKVIWKTNKELKYLINENLETQAI